MREGVVSYWKRTNNCRRYWEGVQAKARTWKTARVLVKATVGVDDFADVRVFRTYQ